MLLRASALVLAALCTAAAAPPPLQPPPPGAGNVIRSVRFEGNHAIAGAELLGAMGLRAGMRWSSPQLSADLAALAALYAREGYLLTVLSARDESGDSTSAAIVITVDEGERLPVGAITLAGTEHIPAQSLLARFETRPGEPLRQETLERDIAGLLARYGTGGYPFTRASIAGIVPDSGALRIAIDVDEGPLTQIDEIRIRGNSETSDGVILRETGIALHEPYNPEKIARIAPRLRRLGIFARVDEPELYLNGGAGGLLLTVEEGNANTFDGVAGYAPAGGAGEEGIVTGFANVGMRNLFGTGRKLGVRWQRDERNAQEIGIRYDEPWLFGIPLAAGGAFTQRQEDTIYVQRGGELHASIPLTDAVSVGATGSVSSVIPSAGSFAVASSTTSTAGGTLAIDTRDDPVSPTTGARGATTLSFGKKRRAGAGPTSARTATADAEFYAGTAPHQVIAVGLHGRERDGDDAELGDLYRLGGTNSLRGYRENQFLGTRVAWTNVEYRFLLARRSYLFGFLDSGYAFLPDGTGLAPLQITKYGYGMGIRLETSLGNLGVSFALGEGDSFTEGKIHIGIINDF